MKTYRRPAGVTRAVSTLVVSIAMLLSSFSTLLVPVTRAAVAPVGQGFTVTPADLAFILKQIKIAERHSRALSGTDSSIPVNPSPTTDPTYCQSMVGRGADQIPDYLTSYGLRTVDGSCNNLVPGRETFAAADQPFPRLANPVFSPAEDSPPAFGPSHPTSYAQKKGSVFDSQPRLISNLIVDQTSTNPAAVAAAGFPVRTQRNPGLFPCTIEPDLTANPPVYGSPANCVPKYHTLFIPNVTTDVGLSPPYNSLFTFFGQFFDHGVDQTVKSGGTVFVPLRDDDPLIAGPDHVVGTADDLDPSLRFMVLTRAQNQPGPDGVLGDRLPTDPGAGPCTSLNVPAGCDESADDVQNANNTDTPWVDQSQTYTSHASHQVFLREYVMNSAGVPVSTGKLLAGLPAGQTYFGSPDGTTGMATWAAVKKQAAEKLGLLLRDTDVTNIPMLAADPYGKFLPGPHGLPQYVTSHGLVEGDLTAPVAVPADVFYFDTPFLTDIAHNADPSPQDTDHNPATPPVAPTPDLDNTPSADFANQPAGTYDDEMLNAHFTAGDGRVNENIALTTIHQIFHSEHDRLVDYVKDVLTNDTTATGVAALAQWKLASGTPDGWNGERLFQAARFVTEMEYQHLVFEEFARKIQPAIRPFHVYHSDINAAIPAEFAHAVYRFGHSMLNDDVARSVETGGPTGTKTDQSIPLLTAFLNPPQFMNGGTSGTLTPEQAAGAVVMGSSDQIGNELDEFVVDTLRNNLLGLPLDLPTLNMTRARDAGVPPLNELRRRIFAATNDGQLKPYTSWSDFGQNIKHPESLINFVAAYGKHPSIVSQTTIAGRRAAAKAIVDPAPGDTTPIPEDAAAFMYGTDGTSSTCPAGCDWRSLGPDGTPAIDGVTTTGVDKIDLWVGGLAEITNLFGGLLGSTFNYVFENTLSNLQDGDRLYYLARTPGLNLRAQLEGNSFAELIQRNTDGTDSLKADAFATADCRFQLANLEGTPAGYAAHGATVADDPTTTDCDESKLLLRKPDGTIQYRQVNSVNPVGINGQAVYNGTPGVDRIWGGNDNDTFWGGAGNDVIEGNGGDDVILGGAGNDIVTDLSGADVLKGGPGNDALDGGIGNDIFMGGDGQDFINGGANDNEAFGGPGNDFIIAGQGADTAFGDGGDDWIQGGSGQDLLIGDHGAPFFDDPAQAAPGNDIMIGQVGENDYDAEGGDDVMSANAAIDRFAGAGGFDWAFHQYNTVPAVDDMMINNNLAGLALPIVVNRDRWQETEADSGGPFNDSIKGQDGVLATPRLVGGAGFTGCDALDQAGVARINGLAAILPPVSQWIGTAAEVAALSATGYCPLTGPVWGEGDILLGGGGSDTITGRAGNEIIDGNRYLNVRISVRTDPADPSTEIGTTDLMEHVATSGNFGPGTSGMTLQAAVFAGKVDPGNLVGVREILMAPTVAGELDTAVFLGPRSNYTITMNAGSVTVTDNVGTDGTDTLFNIEQAQFVDQTVSLLPTATTPDLTSASDSGASTTDNITNVVTPTFAGTAANATDVTLLVDGSPVGTTTVVAGNWSITSTTLTEGTHAVAAQAANGPITGSASAALTVTIDTTAPTPVIGTSPSDPSIDSTPDFTFSSADATAAFQCSLSTGTSTFSFCTSPKTYATQPNGTYTFQVQATDVAGNIGVVSYTFVLNAPPPAAASAATLTTDSGFSATDGITNVATPTLTGTATNATTVTLLDGTTVVGTATIAASATPVAWSITTSALADGLHSITAVASGPVGDGVASAPTLVRIDTVGPVVTMTAPAPAATISGTAAAITASATDPGSGVRGVQFLRDGANLNAQDLAAPFATTINTTLVPAGSHTFGAIATDIAGNTTAAAVVAVTVQGFSTAPDLAAASDTGTSATDNITSVTTPRFTGTTNAATVTVLVDGVAQSATVTGTTWSFTSAALADGLHTFRAQGAAGPLSATLTVRIDTTAPAAPSLAVRFSNLSLGATGTVPVRTDWVTTDVGGVASYTLQRATVTGGVVGAFATQGLAAANSTNIVQQLTQLVEFRYRVRATDVAGNVSAFSVVRATTSTIVQENDPAVVYAGTWTLGSLLPNSSGGTVAFSASGGRTATYTFTGTDIGWVSQRGPNRGIALVSIDGGADVTVDLFAAAANPRNIAFQQTGLAAGTHTIRITVTGTRRAASTSNRVDIDAFVTMP